MKAFASLFGSLIWKPSISTLSRLTGRAHPFQPSELASHQPKNFICYRLIRAKTKHSRYNTQDSRIVDTFKICREHGIIVSAYRTFIPLNHTLEERSGGSGGSGVQRDRDRKGHDGNWGTGFMGGANRCWSCSDVSRTA